MLLGFKTIHLIITPVTDIEDVPDFFGGSKPLKVETGDIPSKLMKTKVFLNVVIDHLLYWDAQSQLSSLVAILPPLLG